MNGNGDIFDQAAIGAFDDLIPAGNSNGVISYVSRPADAGLPLVLEWLAILLPLCVAFLLAWLMWRQRVRIACFWHRNARRWLIAVAAALYLISGLFPPWRITVKDRNGHTHSTQLEISWLFENPRVWQQQYQSSEIARDVLAIEWLLLSGGTLAAYYLFPGRGNLRL